MVENQRNADSTADLVLLTGATGYVGGRLLQALEQRGQRLRCLARRPENLRARVSAEIEVV
ncbi:MAG: NAD-dependent epimerase/dehydratase family protein, partial [Planctomycetaceae bacterium]|nr:NAD-dependent epimerase/dehydratase family protein [Planctomycetaceae bacterium]